MRWWSGWSFGELRGGLEAVVGEVKAFREEHARSMRHVERRLVRLEAGRQRVRDALSDRSRD